MLSVFLGFFFLAIVYFWTSLARLCSVTMTAKGSITKDVANVIVEKYSKCFALTGFIKVQMLRL